MDIDVTGRIQNTRLATHHASPDGLGYFGYNNQIGVYVEIISYEKLVGDAERRNQYFFHKLGLL